MELLGAFIFIGIDLFLAGMALGMRLEANIQSKRQTTPITTVESGKAS